MRKWLFVHSPTTLDNPRSESTPKHHCSHPSTRQVRDSSLRLFLRLPREIGFRIRDADAVVCETIEFLQREGIKIDVVDRTHLATPISYGYSRASQIITYTDPVTLRLRLSKINPNARAALWTKHVISRLGLKRIIREPCSGIVVPSHLFIHWIYDQKSAKGFWVILSPRRVQTRRYPARRQMEQLQLTTFCSSNGGESSTVKLMEPQ